MSSESSYAADGGFEMVEPQARNRLLHLSDQLDRVQDQLKRLDDEWQAGSSQLDALARTLTTRISCSLSSSGWRKSPAG
ncbi:MAG: hypothetical protein HC802_10265 [Caldilineaceae bacterium]|nr:hypothetical protein [Caldilineaceae bacterium]